jgi:prevent-host-death family protein
MPVIKPISDLRNYPTVLQDVDAGHTVFLTKNGRGRYAIIDLAEYEKISASLQLFKDLAKGEQSAVEQGWLSHEDVLASLGVTSA